MKTTSLIYKIIRFPVAWLTKVTAIADEHDEQPSAPEHVVYVMQSPSATDLVVARKSALKLNLPDPTEPLLINGKLFNRVS